MPDFFMAAQKAIRATLIARSDLITLLGGTAFYYRQAPDNAPANYVVFSYLAGGSENVTPRDSWDTRWGIEFVGSSPQTAGSAAGIIYDALHNNFDIGLDAPYQTIKMQHTARIDRIENIDRKQIWHAGGVYRLRATTSEV